MAGRESSFPGLTTFSPHIPRLARHPAVLIPGERFNQTIVQYLQFARMFNARFPGFDTDINGLFEKVVDGKRQYCVDCVWQSSTKKTERADRGSTSTARTAILGRFHSPCSAQAIVEKNGR